MKKHVISVAAATTLLLLAGCNNQPESKVSSSALTVPAEAKPTPENTAVIVNGKPISKAFYQSLVADVQQRSGGQAVPEDKILDGIIVRELLNQEAEKQNLLKDPAVALRLDNAKRDVLVQAYVENYRKTAVISDDDVKKEYDSRVATLSGAEYKARHILLETEQAAKDVVAKLQKGAKFEELAKKLSKDSSNAKTGGELGWFTAGRMVPEFSAAVAALKNGETSTTPVKTQFGWHVIQREESREQAPPPFDAVKDQFRTMLLGQKLQKHVEELKAAAKIERLLPPTPAPKADAVPALPTGQPALVEPGKAVPPAPVAPSKPK